MNNLSNYNISFKGLKEGKHEFHYKLEKPFFDAIEDSTIENGDFEANVILYKKSQMLQLDFNIVGKVQTICDNCLGEVTVPVSYDGTMFIKLGIMYDEPSEEIIILPQEEYEYNIAQLMYEFIVVSMPLRSVHEDDESCDPEMMNKLDEFSAKHHEEDSKSEATDPRWDALKKLKDNSNK